MQIFPIRSFYVDLQGFMHLKSLFRPIFAFKETIFRHFAGYASLALETIWLHEPRDLIFLGPLMTLLCLSRYSRLGSSVLHTACHDRLTQLACWQVGPT